jgi:4-hydroxy-3-polyprenylbenzoate decarboxylase
VNGVVDCRHLFSDHPENNAPINRILAMSVTKGPTQNSREIGKRLSAIPILSAFNILILFDENIDLSNGGILLWKVFNNVDPERDIIPCGRLVVIDACKKGPADGHDRPWPEDLSF